MVLVPKNHRIFLDEFSLQKFESVGGNFAPGSVEGFPRTISFQL